MFPKLMLSTGAALLLGSMALADAFTDQVVAQLQDQGFRTTEIKTRNGQTKFEAVRGTQKIEVVYDRTTGQVVSQETYFLDANDSGSGPQTGGSGSSDDSSGDDHGSDDHESEDHGSDDHESDDHGSDDHESDDHGSDDHESDDHGSDDDDDDDHDDDDHDDDDDEEDDDD
ncbi:PepSY domain-containing protein [Tropicibacter oceani]|uniref:PepSY domain-containing protein n=1 Tax=Tropicibacter oceani TaxID=3058420 RepID=A0ABY8QM02_9RHOB|nr:PepSY domain-containing protein [Tropicibacter oceani]WGW05669.1 PepSY domain-containing protein [Tropicibacter oceani]